MDNRKERGMVIAQKDGQIECIDATHYAVKSQSGNGSYIVTTGEEGMCTCMDYLNNHVCCKHMHAVGFLFKMHEKTQDDVEIPEVKIDRCPVKKCRSRNIKKGGVRHNKCSDVQMFMCNDCGKKFSGNLGFERMRATPDQITTAMNLYFSGESYRKTAYSLRRKKIKVTHKTIENWVKKYIGLMDEYLEKIIPQVGGVWRTDEIELKIRKDKKFLYAMLDAETRFWLAGMVAGHKGTDDVRPMFKDSKKLARKVPLRFVSDGAGNFKKAHEQEYKPKNFLHPPSEHIRHIHLAGDMDNNQQESFNSNTLRLRLDATRGLKTTDSAVIPGLRIFHNFIRPHQGLKEDTPADRAGIRVLGDGKWKTIIQNAAREEVSDD